MPILCDVVEAGIACVTISNPRRRNALDLEMFEELARLWPRLADDAAVRVVVMRGAGGDAFCSGADLHAHLDRRDGIDDLVDRALLKTGFFPKPLVAAIEGACVAGGLELALAADIRLAAEDATIGFPEVTWGIVPSGGGAMKLIDQIGHAASMDLLLTGRLVSGREACSIGLVGETCPVDRVWSNALAKARLVAAGSASAIRVTKQCALARRAIAYRSLEPEERERVAAHRLGGDPDEGKAAFIEGRPPVFR